MTDILTGRHRQVPMQVGAESTCVTPRRDPTISRAVLVSATPTSPACGAGPRGRRMQRHRPHSTGGSFPASHAPHADAHAGGRAHATHHRGRGSRSRFRYPCTRTPSGSSCRKPALPGHGRGGRTRHRGDRGTVRQQAHRGGDEPTGEHAHRYGTRRGPSLVRPGPLPPSGDEPGPQLLDCVPCPSTAVAHASILTSLSDTSPSHRSIR